jgi:hypothetical protein
MRPRAEAASRLFPGRIALYAPRTRIGISASALAMRAVQRPIVRKALGALMGDRGHGGGS